MRSEHNRSGKKRQTNGRCMDDASNTRGIKYLNVDTWLLFPPYENFWLRTCT